MAFEKHDRPMLWMTWHLDEEIEYKQEIAENK